MRRSAAVAAVLLVAACGTERAREAAARPEADAAPVGCRETTAARPPARDEIFEDVTGRRTFACVLRAGMRPLEVTTVGDSALNAVARVELREQDEDQPRQILVPGDDETPPPHGADFVRAEDLDGDGVGELLLRIVTGATGNVRWHLWRFAPDSGRFVEDRDFAEITSPRAIPGRPCVASHGVGGSAGRVYEDGEWCREGGRWVPVWTEAQSPDTGRGDGFLRVRRERRDGRLVVVRVDTVPGGEP